MKLYRSKNKSAKSLNLRFDSPSRSSPNSAVLKDYRNSEVVQKKPNQYFIDNRVNKKSIQRKADNKGLPDNLKSGIEQMSGIDMGDVKVHYNSDKPVQLNAHAYTQGSDIYLASGQEKHLPHEAWHVVQQKQGRVKATKLFKEKVSMNDDVYLEKEADVMGQKALQLKTSGTKNISDAKDGTSFSERINYKNTQLLNINNATSPIVQRAMGMEIELGRGVGSKSDKKLVGDAHIIEEPTFNLVTDSRGNISNIEFVMAHFDQHEGDEGQAIGELTTRLEKMKELYDLITGFKGQKILSEVASGYNYATKSIPTKEDNKETTKPNKVRLLASAPGADDLFVQYTIGIDLTRMYEGISLIEEKSYNHNNEIAKEHAKDALKFSATLIEGDLKNIEDKEAVKGYLALLYMQVAAFADAIQGKINKKSGDKFPTKEAIERSSGQIKNKTILLSRVPLETIFKKLSAEAQTTLDSKEDGIITYMADLMETRGMSFAEEATRDMKGLDSIRLIDYIRSGLKKGEDTVIQQRVFGGMKEVSIDESVPGKRAVPLELRSYQKTFMNWAEMEAYAKELLIYSRKLHV